jgi:U3 small nucleolar RNA-associated protein 6
MCTTIKFNKMVYKLCIIFCVTLFFFNMASYYLEQMLVDLDILQNRGIFSENEVKSIIKERTHYEYAIHRRIPKKTDFLKYLEYEINLEQLLRLRREKLTKGQKLSSRERAADFSILKRIHYLYQKTLKKYAQDVDIWLQYFDYCQETGSAKILGRFYVK